MTGDDRHPRRLLDRAGTRGDPARDQHFLIDERVLERIADYGRDLVGSSATVLEVGAGTGALTARLLDVVDRAVAIERDRRLGAFLRREFASEREDGRLEVIVGDALAVDLPPFDAVVANLPYGAASEILFRVLPRGRPMVVMVQREFAERMVADAGTGEYGRLTVTTGYWAEASIRETVPPTAFEPAPPVDSAVVTLEPRRPAPAVDHDAFADLVTAVFTQRRKTLRNAIRNTTHISGIEEADALLADLEDDLLAERPDDVDPSTYVDLARRVTERRPDQ